MQIPTYQSSKDGIKEYTLPSPISFSAGDYLGLISRDSSALQIKSISSANHSSGKGKKLFYADTSSYSERTTKMKTWEGAVCIGFYTTSGGGGGSAALVGSYNLVHPVWKVPSSKIKGWVVKTSVHGKPMPTVGKLTKFKIQHNDSLRKELSVLVMKKSDKTFSIIREHKLSAYDSRKDGITTVAINPPLNYSTGDYVGISSRNLNNLQVQSCSAETDACAKGKSTVSTC